MKMTVDSIETFAFSTMSQWWVKDLLVPVIGLLLAIMLKAVSKKTLKFERNDCFICFDLCSSAVFVLLLGIVNTVNLSLSPTSKRILESLKGKDIDPLTVDGLSDLIGSGSNATLAKLGLSLIILFLTFLIILITVCITRAWGWNADGTKVKLMWGIIFPNSIGLFLLGSVARLISI
jgi:hypothetical protein